MAKTSYSILPTVGVILIVAIVCMIIVNAFQINMNDNSGLKVLNRSATFEGFKEGKTNAKRAGSARRRRASGRGKK